VIVDPVTAKVDEAATAKLRASPPTQRYEAVINEETLAIEIKPMDAPMGAPTGTPIGKPIGAKAETAR
jgi:hypothetical protein